MSLMKNELPNIQIYMKHKHIIVIIGALLISLCSCIENLLPVRGNGIIVTETRRSGEFNKIENSTLIDIIYKKADTTGITLTGDENLLEYIVTETLNSTLEIKTRTESSYMDFKERPLIIITSPNLEKVVITGSGNFVADEMAGDGVFLKMSGSGDISVENITCPDLSVMTSGSGNIIIKECQSERSDILLTGSGNITINGRSKDCSTMITGSGNLFAENYLLDSASIIVSGSGDSYITVEHDLTVIISGSGSIYLKGNPTISQTISGSGRIIKYK